MKILIRTHKEIKCKNKKCKAKEPKHHAKGYCKACYLKQLRDKWKAEKISG